MWKALAPLIGLIVEALVKAIRKANYRTWRQDYEEKLESRVDRARGDDRDDDPK